MTVFRPRPAQEKILRYRSGMLGISAVPGSGKTWTLSRLAADLIRGGALAEGQEILVVTLVNSAVDNFKSRIGSFVQDLGLLPGVGYRVRTLHGLANDIVGERPDLVGISEAAYILDERAADQILADVTRIWLRNHPGRLDPYFDPMLEESRVDWINKEQLPQLVHNIAGAFITLAKDYEQTPAALAARLEDLPAPLPLAEMGAEIYRDYQRALAYRGAVDFDDLIRLAAEALQLDPDLLARLQERWPYILEDEAQDSSRLQEKILRLLAGGSGNWVRVGDPNQAIFETFTTASPESLRRFMREPGVRAAELPNSGRSTESVIRLANTLIRWTAEDHPVVDLRSALAPPYIEPTPAGDPQPNPPDEPDEIYLYGEGLAPAQELKAILDSLERWLPGNPDATVAVLVPTNSRGFKLSEGLRQRGLAYVEVLRSARQTRLTAGALGNILNYLSDPKSARRLATCYRVWRRDLTEEPETKAAVEAVSDTLKTCPETERYLWPLAGEDWLDELALEPDFTAELTAFREIVRRWQEATVLPIDQLVLTLAQDLFTDPADLALAHKLALVLKRAGTANIDWRLPELTDELAVVARNERRFLGFSEEDAGFNPDAHPGKVVVTTMHKAKGLEWDRVYLTSVNNYDFPSAQEYDRYISEKWFIRDRLDLQAETLAELRQVFSDDPFDWPETGAASERSRIDYASERLRLFFVGITRARRALIVTWNTGRKGDQRQALPFAALESLWEMMK
ncbi:MAG TPA: ATP-dependent helicase [Anaerolineales bacterium]|nr:ATP-dependent helicase [Anaerolineales bacterium]